MSRVSSCATTPAASAISTARTQTNTTRPSTSVRSSGTRAASSAGAMEGATGIPSVVAPVTTSSTGIRPPRRPGRGAAAPAGAALLEEHGRRAGGELHPFDQLEESRGQLLAPPVGQPPHHLDEALLRQGGRGAQHGPAPDRESQLRAPAGRPPGAAGPQA